MENIYTTNTERIVVKYTTQKNVGLEPIHYSRYAIGYVIHGEKYIHDNDELIRIAQGEVFFLGLGTHYIENIPEVDGMYEQITFYYTPSKMQQIIASISSLELNNSRAFSRTPKRNVASEQPNKILRNFFISANNHLEYGGFILNDESEKIKLTELAHIIATNQNSPIQEMLINSLDHEKANFEKVIYRNILNDKTIDELAAECNRSLTSFKKEFKQIFQLPPHQWYLRQRLLYARLLLKTTRESISQVGDDCAFPNTSHFIKLFKRYYGYTPATYRSHFKTENKERRIHVPEAHNVSIAQHHGEMMAH